MSKRTHQEIRKAILNILKNNEEYSYGHLERKVNTNWQTIRNHCADLKLFKAVTISKDNKIKITKQGKDILKKM